MCNENLESIMAKYLEGLATEQESLLVLDYLMESERNRRMFNIAASGYTRMMPKFKKEK